MPKQTSAGKTLCPKQPSAQVSENHCLKKWNSLEVTKSLRSCLFPQGNVGRTSTHYFGKFCHLLVFCNEAGYWNRCLLAISPWREIFSAWHLPVVRILSARNYEKNEFIAYHRGCLWLMSINKGVGLYLWDWGFCNVLFELSIKAYFSRSFPNITPNLITTNRRKYQRLISRKKCVCYF